MLCLLVSRYPEGKHKTLTVSLFPVFPPRLPTGGSKQRFVADR